MEETVQGAQRPPPAGPLRPPLAADPPRPSPAGPLQPPLTAGPPRSSPAGPLRPPPAAGPPRPSPAGPLQPPLAAGPLQPSPAGRRRSRRIRGTGPLRRVPEGRLAGGVAAGVAARTGFDPTAVRVVLVLASLVSGLGTAAYVVAWLVVPAAGADASIGRRAVTDRRGIALAAALGSLLVVLLLVASALGAQWLGSLSWPLVVSVAGLVLIHRNAPPDEQEVLRRLAQPLLDVAGHQGRRRTGLRVAIAAVLLAVGVATLLSGQASAAVLRPLGGVVLVLAAVVLLLGPWWLRIAQDLGVERSGRIRAEERADMAARVHDSVLQTLALIQRRADEPQRVVQLARAQERELRAWLFDGRAPGSPAEGDSTVAGGVRLLQSEVEARHGVAVEVVVVGDCPLDDLRALLAAAREATVNAARWSGAGVVALFAEVEPERVSVFVRDRGRGFDPTVVPTDRRGLTESIRGRMLRRGGTATVRSVVGEGTEVSLSVPRGGRGNARP